MNNKIYLIIIYILIYILNYVYSDRDNNNILSPVVYKDTEKLIDSSVKRSCCCCEFTHKATYAYITDCSQTCYKALSINLNKYYQNNSTYMPYVSSLYDLPLLIYSNNEKNEYCRNICHIKSKTLKPHHFIHYNHKKNNQKKPKVKKQPMVFVSKCLWYQAPDVQCETDAWSPIRNAIDETIKGYKEVEKRLKYYLMLDKINLKMALSQVYSKWKSHCKLWVCLSNVNSTFFFAEYDSKDGQAHTEKCSKLMGYKKLDIALRVLTRYSNSSTYLAAPFQSRYWLMNGIGKSIAKMCLPFIQTSKPFQTMKCWVNEHLGEQQLKIWRLFSDALDCTREGVSSVQGCDWENKLNILQNEIDETTQHINQQQNSNSNSACFGVFGKGLHSYS